MSPRPFVKNLTFQFNDLGKEVMIMLAWSPNVDGLYEDVFPIVWNTWAAAQAKAEPKPAITGGFGLAWNFRKPKPSEARPKPWLLSQAGLEHH
ncbi:hypothetical protein EV424DRAFT_1535895 [Suillus variegatus]|nr:hypothetical protein EV424DRAFT_1535895 [Suillus variegatus]